ncbi:Hypothetical protein Cp3995_1492 [Corynebacterium pseudotuberculosis 3/99-5]|nr:Hypothetical protein Cp3995_1492 [Corynebacterium pseudotuberculosis 3/99-5]
MGLRTPKHCGGLVGQSGFLVEDADEQLGDVVREVLQIHVLAVGGDVLGDEFLGGARSNP